MDIKSAAAKAASETVERATKGFFDWIWGIFTSVLSIGFWGGLIAFVADLFFPQIGFRGWISDIMEKLGIKGMFNGLLAMLDPETAESIASFAERNIPWVGESIASMLRNAPREAILAMNDDEFEKTMRERTGVPEIGAELRKVSQKFKDFLKANTTIDPRQLTSKEGITALLNSQDGRAVVGAILTGYESARAPGGSIATRAANTQASAMETQLPAVLRQIVADQATFTQIMQNPQNRALIYRAAPLAAGAAGIQVTNPQVFTQALTAALTPLPPPQQAQIFSDLANPAKAGEAMQRLYFDRRVPAQALFAMVQSIDPGTSTTMQPSVRDALLQGRPSGAPAPTGPALQAALTNFTQRREAVQQMGAQTIDALTRTDASPQDKIRAIAEALTRSANPITAAHLTTLVGMVPPPTGNAAPEPAAIAMLRNPGTVNNLVRFIQEPSVGANNFTHLATTLLASGTAATTGGASALLHGIFSDANKTNALIAFHNTLGAAKFNEIVPLVAQQPPPIHQIAGILGDLNQQQKTAALAFVRTLTNGDSLASGLGQLMTLTPQQRNALTGIMNGMSHPMQERLLPQLQALFGENGQINTERLLSLLMDDEIRQALAAKTAELATLLRGRVPQNAQPLVTPRNLGAMFRLVEVIDRTTGGGATEQAADAKNTRVIRTLVGIANGDRPVGELRTLGREIAEVMNNQERVVAFREFLEGFGVTGLDERHQRVFGVLREKWWNDVNGDEIFQPRQNGNGNIRNTSYGDGGLAAFLANPDAARILLELMRNPQPRDLSHNVINTATSLGMMEALTWGQWGQGWLSQANLASPPEPTLHPDLDALQRVLIPSVAPASVSPTQTPPR